MKILLTGASGFIGNALRKAWVNQYDLYAPNHSELDLLEMSSVESYLRMNSFDVVVHAANTNNVIHPELATNLLEYNLRMFCNLERCHDLYGKMLYFGSGAEYDMNHYVPKMKESYFGKHIPADPYGFSKYIMSKITERKENIYNFRLFGVYGCGEEWRRRFISNMIYQAFTCSEMKMDQNRLFDYLYIDDLVNAIDSILTCTPKHHHYNLCSSRVVSLYELAEMVKVVTGTNAEIVVDRMGWKPEYSGDNSLFANEFGELHISSMRETVRYMVDYYRNNGFN